MLSVAHSSSWNLPLANNVWEKIFMLCQTNCWPLARVFIDQWWVASLPPINLVSLSFAIIIMFRKHLRNGKPWICHVISKTEFLGVAKNSTDISVFIDCRAFLNFDYKVALHYYVAGPMLFDCYCSDGCINIGVHRSCVSINLVLRCPAQFVLYISYMHYLKLMRFKVYRKQLLKNVA